MQAGSNVGWRLCDVLAGGLREKTKCGAGNQMRGQRGGVGGRHPGPKTSGMPAVSLRRIVVYRSLPVKGWGPPRWAPCVRRRAAGGLLSRWGLGHHITRPPWRSTACTSQSMATRVAISRSASSSGEAAVARHMSVLQRAGAGKASGHKRHECRAGRTAPQPPHPKCSLRGEEKQTFSFSGRSSEQGAWWEAPPLTCWALPCARSSA